MLCSGKWVKTIVSYGGVFDLAVEQQQLFRKLSKNKQTYLKKGLHYQQGHLLLPYGPISTLWKLEFLQSNINLRKNYTILVNMINDSKT